MKHREISARRFSFLQAVKESADASMVLLLLLTALYPIGTLSEFTVAEKLLTTGTQAQGAQSLNDLYTAMMLPESFASSSFILLPAIALLSAVSAFMAFSFTTRSKKLNVMFSLGQKRSELFTARVAASLGSLLAAIFVPLTACLVINIIKLGASREIFELYFFHLIMLTVTTLVIYAVCCIGMLVSNRIKTGVVTSVALLALPFAFTACMQAYACAFLRGFPSETAAIFRNGNTGSFLTAYISKVNMLEELSFLNPLLLMLGKVGGRTEYLTMLFPYYSGPLSGTQEYFYKPVPSQFILRFAVWAVVGAALIFAARFIFCTSKAENAGRPGAGITAGFVLAAEAALVAGAAAVGLNAMLPQTPGVVLAAAVTAAVFFISAFVLLRKRLKLKRIAVPAPAAAVFSVALSLILMSGGFGYSEPPQVQNVESVQITMPFERFAFTGPYITLCNFKAAVVHSNVILGQNTNECKYMLTDPEEIKQLTEIAASAAKNKNPEPGYSLELEYTLKDSSKLERRFVNITNDTFIKMLLLYDLPSIKAAAQARLGSGENNYGTGNENLLEYGPGNMVFICSGKYGTQTDITANLTGEEYNELARCISHDYGQMSVTQLFFPEKAQYGYIVLGKGNDSADTDETPYDAGKVIAGMRYRISLLIYEDMQSTVQFLKDRELLDLFFVPAGIQSVTVYKQSAPMANMLVTRLPILDADGLLPVERMLTNESGSEILRKVSKLNGGSPPTDINADLLGLVQEVVTDKARIEQLLESARMCYCWSGGSGRLIKVTYDKTWPEEWQITEKQSSTYFYIPD